MCCVCLGFPPVFAGVCMSDGGGSTINKGRGRGRVVGQVAVVSIPLFSRRSLHQTGRAFIGALSTVIAGRGRVEGR